MRNLRLVVFIVLFNIGCSDVGVFASCAPPCNPSVPVGQPGSCPIPGIADGQPGGKCATWLVSQNWCNSGECIDGTCLGCGSATEPCCGPNYYGDGCGASAGCQNQSNGNRICSSSCGVVGLQCCNQTDCNSGGHCVNGTCVTNGLGTCGGGSTAYEFAFINPTTKCIDFTYKDTASDASAAQACAVASAPASFVNDTVKQVSGDPPLWDECGKVKPGVLSGNGPSTYHIPGLADSDAQTCAESMYPDETITPGPCM